jgi:diguanylate cyclase (GGDEF)-like protein/PAS domain S-box-containing protein
MDRGTDWWRIPRVWLFVAVLLLIAVLDALVGADVVLIPLFTIAVVGSATIGRWGVTIGLGALALLLATVLVASDGVPAADAAVRLLALVLATGIGAILAKDAARSRAELEEERSRYLLLAENASDVVGSASMDGVTTWMSPGITRLTGWRPEDLVGQPFAPLVHPDDLDVLASIRLRTGPEDHAAGELRVRCRDGSYRWISSSVRPLHDESGELVGRAFGWRDVQSEREARDALAVSEARFRLLAENSPDVIVLSVDDAMTWVSPSLAGSLGWEPRDWIGHSGQEFVHPDDRAALREGQARVLEGEIEVARVRMLAKDGGYHWAEIHAGPFTDGEGKVVGVSASFRLVDAEVAAEAELRRAARIDDLTGTATRDVALNRLAHIGRRRRAPGDESAALFIDVDGFKDVNDRYGHSAGDVALATIARRIGECVRSGDLVARMGGDEFLVILEGVHDVAEAETIAEKIRARAAEPIRWGDNDLRLTVSIGAAVSAPIESADALVSRADAAMYRAKRAGRNRVESAVDSVAP